jgi:hypothetical protein
MIMVKRIAQFCSMAGVMLHMYTATFRAEGSPSLFLVGLLLWSCAPYGVSLVLLLLARKPVLAMGYGATSLGFDIYTYVTVFVWPSSSTAALGLLVMPIWNLVLFGPAGAFVAWVIFKIYSRKHN